MAREAKRASRQPLGYVVVGGLLFSQLVTLYLTPVVLHLHGAAAGAARAPVTAKQQPGRAVRSVGEIAHRTATLLGHA